MMRLSTLLSVRTRHVATESLGDYQVNDEFEVADLLIQIVRKRLPLTLATPDGSNYTTQLVAVDSAAKRITLAATSRDLRLRDLVDADEAVAVAYLDRVRVQFDLSGMVMVHGSKDSFMQAQWPQEIYRFQRRDSYRVAPLEYHNPMMRTEFPIGLPLVLRILDVSTGGLALMLPQGALVIQPGTQFDRASVDLDVFTRIEGALRVVHVSVMGNEDAAPSRLGCEWVVLPDESQRALQRYVDQTQKRQRQRESGTQPA